MPDQALVEQLRARLPDEFSQRRLDGALSTLTTAAQDMRAQQFAVTIRELIDHVLEVIGPNVDVVRCSWFRQQRQQPGATRRQRALYACRGGLPDVFLTDTLKIDPDTLNEELAPTFETLNEHTHVRPDSLVADAAQIDAFANDAIEAFLAVFTTIDDVRRDILSAIDSVLQDEATGAFIRETISALDEISGHYSIDQVWIDETEVQKLDADVISCRIASTVDVTLLYGSASDRARDMGAEISDDYPFECFTVAPAATPTAFNTAQTTIKVDITSWFA